MDDHQKLPDRISVPAACAVIGGDRPINPATYYRGVRRGIYPAPDRIGPNVARVNTRKLMQAIAARESAST
jgi:hypothetical protein